MEVLESVYPFISFVAFCVLALAALGYESVDLEIVLSDRKEFIKCVFIFQVFVYEALKGTINKVGIAIVEILLTYFIYPWNVIFFVLLVFVKVIVFICHIFWLIFRIRKDDDNV